MRSMFPFFESAFVDVIKAYTRYTRFRYWRVSKHKFNETENSFKNIVSPNPVDLAMDQKFIIEKLASNGWNKKLFGFHLVIQSIQSIRRILLTPHRHILVIGKASQGKQFNSRIAALCAGFEEHVLALNSNIDGE